MADNLQDAHRELERRVQERTAELSHSNQVLTAQIAERQAAEKELASQRRARPRRDRTRR
jgi:two-component system CheB/CheR fusion protein